ncbi:hypothetical protein MNBD_ALPHA06-1322 [hydrothermal vent metagenome]|uniref:Smr domain-containing protein n=1 Tax=hydrothermal vent metagenome TaxID=652676 RepID=A0A3B0RI75_9ZZZZ
MNNKPQDEDAAWQRVKAQTRPLRGKTIETAKKTTPNKVNKQRPIRDANLAEKHRAEPPRNQPSREDGHRRVRRGKIEIHGQIDLHGLYEAKARTQLLEFVLRSICPQPRTLLVITGKGIAGQGVLRRALSGWMSSVDFSPHVRGFAQAHTRHGGSGAWYVFLRRKPGAN